MCVYRGLGGILSLKFGYFLYFDIDKEHAKGIKDFVILLGVMDRFRTARKHLGHYSTMFDLEFLD